jgi:hypothetical protein
MGLLYDLKRRIDRKQQEIAELEGRVRESKAYLQALQDTVKVLPKDADVGTTSDSKLRSNSMVGQARITLKRHGSPMHVTKILESIGKAANKKNRASLSGSLSQYVRKQDIFTRPEPNVFGLLEWDLKPPESLDTDIDEEIRRHEEELMTK